MLQKVLQPTEKQYHLRCKVLVQSKTVDQERVGGKITRIETKMVYLLPLESTQRDLFYAAWMPEVDEDDAANFGGTSSYEIGLLLGSPVSGPARATFHRANREVPAQPHIFIMSLGASKDLEPLDGRTIEVTVLSEKDDEVLDLMKDADLVLQDKRDEINDAYKTPTP